MAQQRVSKRARSAPTRLVAAEEEAPAAKKPRAPKAAPTSLKAKQATTKNPTKAKAKRATKKIRAGIPPQSIMYSPRRRPTHSRCKEVHTCP